MNDISQAEYDATWAQCQPTIYRLERDIFVMERARLKRWKEIMDKHEKRGE